MNVPAGGPKVDGNIPDIPFKSLVERDEQNHIKPLPMPMEIMALDRNPTVGEPSMYRIKPYLRERRATIDKIAIDNLDMIQQIETGVIDRLDIKKKEQLIALTEMLRPLTSQGPLSTDLRKRDLLTKMQTGMNQKIVKQYQTELLADVKAKAKAAGLEEAPEVTKVLLYNSVDEVMFSYKLLLMDTGKRLANGAAKPAEEYIKIARAHLEPMKLEDKQAELRKTVELRPPPPPDGPPPVVEKRPVEKLDADSLEKRGKLTPEQAKALREKEKKEKEAQEKNEYGEEGKPKDPAPAPKK